ncbi:hypothetical protein NP493_444g02002 [Ridgeia piscesae]|uniref:VWFA domain-containing protein n=1 Tax=Ridgeia piscesae TaxID=27915 RepID=A0AAD9L0N6_RIDPI|nr:hypothetical protein NP493_444g02002 [Ridgeia piscesae]
MASKQMLFLLVASAAMVAVVRSQCKVDFVFIVDGSGSICGNQPNECDNWRSIKQFLRSVVSKMSVGPNGSKVAMVTFGSIGNLIWDLDTYSDSNSLQNAIDQVKYLNEKTNTSHALDLVRTRVFGGKGDRAGVPNVAILITDGLPSNKTNPFVDGRGLARSAAQRLKDSGVDLITVGVTSQIDAQLLKDLSSPPQ